MLNNALIFISFQNAIQLTGSALLRVAVWANEFIRQTPSQVSLASDQSKPHSVAYYSRQSSTTDTMAEGYENMHSKYEVTLMPIRQISNQLFPYLLGLEDVMFSSCNEHYFICVTPGSLYYLIVVKIEYFIKPLVAVSHFLYLLYSFVVLHVSVQQFACLNLI